MPQNTDKNIRIMNSYFQLWNAFKAIFCCQWTTEFQERVQLKKNKRDTYVKPVFALILTSLMKKDKWHTLESYTEEEHKRYYGYTITGINQILGFQYSGIGVFIKKSAIIEACYIIFFSMYLVWSVLDGKVLLDDTALWTKHDDHPPPHSFI